MPGEIVGQEGIRIEVETAENGRKVLRTFTVPTVEGVQWITAFRVYCKDGMLLSMPTGDLGGPMWPPLPFDTWFLVGDQWRERQRERAARQDAELGLVDDDG